MAEAGVDMIAPSDMMDGRVAALRNALDENDFSNIPIMSYSAKYVITSYSIHYTKLYDLLKLFQCYT